MYTYNRLSDSKILHFYNKSKGIKYVVAWYFYGSLYMENLRCEKPVMTNIWLNSTFSKSI